MIKILITIAQVLILLPPIVLQYLSDKKMGIERYLVFKKDMLSKEIFTTNLMVMYKFMLFLGIIICTIIFIRNYIKKTNKTLRKSVVKVIILNLLVMICITSKQFEQVLTYHFFLIAFSAFLILQYTKVILDYKNNC